MLKQDIDKSVLSDLTKVEDQSATGKPTTDKLIGESEEESGDVQKQNSEQAKDNDENKETMEKHARVKEPTKDDDNPDNNYIVEEFPPVLASCHQDSFIRFWDMEVRCSDSYELISWLGNEYELLNSPVTLLQC